MRYEAVKVDGQFEAWRVDAIDLRSGKVFNFAFFTGEDAEARAVAYAAWQNWEAGSISVAA